MVSGSINQFQINDDIRREQQLYELAKRNFSKYAKVSEIPLVRKDHDCLFKSVEGEIVYNEILKSAVRTKNLKEKDLNSQAKKIQQLVADKQKNEQKFQRMVEQVKKAMKRPVSEQQQEPVLEEELPRKDHGSGRWKKGIKKPKAKRIGKIARLRLRLKRASRR